MISGAERRRLLARMGIAVFVPRGTPAPPPARSRPGAEEDEGLIASTVEAEGGEDAFAASAPAPGPAPSGSGSLADGNAPFSIPPTSIRAPSPAAGTGGLPSVSALGWPDLEAAVASCVACALHRGRRRTVFGTGAREADWLVIGEAPGANEDRQGEPFVGRAGGLLNAMLHAIGLAREEVFITNSVKCRPPGNRDPEPAETGRCGPYLDRQIELLAPRVILAAGRIAAQTILETDAPLARLRGREHSCLRGGRRIPVVATYHPAYLLRKPIAKRDAWEDLCLARSIVARSP